MTHGCKPNGKFRKAVQDSPMSRISTTSITGSMVSQKVPHMESTC